MATEDKKNDPTLADLGVSEAVAKDSEEAAAAGVMLQDPPDEVLDRAVMAALTAGDADIDGMSAGELRTEAKRLRGGIRSHRDQRGDDRCWKDDEKLYALVPDGMAQTALDEALMRPNCERFFRLRVNPRDRFSWGDVPGGSMFPVLDQAELELPSLIMVAEDWQSLLVDDERPNVERLWMPYGEGRLMLHVIHPCSPGESLYHPHPWASAMRIHEGWYETAHGHGPPDGPPPPMGEKKAYGPGHRYEMVNPEAWHFVRPLGDAAITVMVTGKPWRMPGNRKGRSLGPLSDERVQEMLALFRGLYPRR